MTSSVKFAKICKKTLNLAKKMADNLNKKA